MTDNRQRYDRRTVLLHWWTAGLVTFQWSVGRLNHLLPKGPLRLDIWSVHVLVGFALAAVILMRIWWRLTRGRRLPPADRGVRHVLAEGTHALLYVLLVGVAGLGVLNVSRTAFRCSACGVSRRWATRIMRISRTTGTRCSPI